LLRFSDVSVGPSMSHDIFEAQRHRRRVISFEKSLALTLLAIMSLFPMLRRTVAALLLVLVASPFTAPFETCDLTALFGSPTTAPLQVQVAWLVEEDCHAVAPGATASRRVRQALQPIPEAAPTRTTAPMYKRPAILLTTSSERTPQSPPASRSPLRI
jgi:hypothetical protein